MLLGPIHCMFLLTCFGSKLSGGPYELICPSGCDCYSAAADGIAGNTSSAVSVVCDRPEPLYSYTSFRWRAINTLVIRQSSLHSRDFTSIPKAHLVLSFVLEQCTVGDPAEPRNIFQLLNGQYLRYLTVVNTGLEGVDWTVLRKFDHLYAIYIDQSTLPTLDGTFASVLSPNLHTISIKDSQLRNIDREAFGRKEMNLQRLALPKNQLNNFVWLQAYNRSWKRLWYLDLRDNQLTYLPDGLRLSLPNLEVFYLANNPIKYLSPASLEPWFSLTEFMLAAYSQSSSIKNRIYYTEEMQTVKNLLTQKKPAFDYFPAFFLESIKETLRYDCMLSKNDQSPLLTSFGNLDDCDYENPYPHVYNFWPDNLHFNHQGKLIEGKPMIPYEVLKVVQLEGTDFNAYLTSLDQLEVFIDSLTNMDEYRVAREAILTQLSNQMNGNALRLNLFGPSTFEYLEKSISEVHSKAQITLWMDFLEEVLSSAQAMNKYVILVIFKYEKFDFSSGNINFDDTATWLELKLGPTLSDLASRVDAQSALVGIEVASGFLTADLISFLDEPSADNDCLGKYLETQLRAIHSAAAFLKSKLKDKLVGVNIDAGCQFCLHGAMLDACQKTSINLALPKKYQLDFVSLTSNLNDLSEVYSHKNWPSNEPAFFKNIILETLSQDEKRPLKPGFFFILKDDGQGMNVLEAKSEIESTTTAAGVIVMPLKSSSSASSDLLGETIVRQSNRN